MSQESEEFDFEFNQEDKINKHTEVSMKAFDLGYNKAKADHEKFIEDLKKRVKETSCHKVMNGNASPELLRECRYWEKTGREDERKLVLAIIDELSQQEDKI